MHISIPIETIGSLLGASMVLIFALYSLIYLKSYQFDLKVFSFLFVQLSLFLYLLGYSLFTSARFIENIEFWTKVCYIGITATISASYCFCESFFNRQNRVKKILAHTVTTILILAILLPGEHFFTNQLNPEKSYNTLLKGPFYSLLVITSLFSHLLIIMNFSLDLLKKKELRKLASPLIVGFIILFINGLHDGILASLLSIGKPHLWIGATAMAGGIAIFTAQSAHRRHAEADQLRSEKEKIYFDLIRDKLTGLFSRDYFIENLKQTSLLINRNDQNCSIVFLDLDNFKLINDHFGHGVGDRVLEITGEIVTKNIRKSDIAARLGGDEFLIQLIDCEDSCARKICTSIQKDFKTKINNLLGSWDKLHQISISMGCTTFAQLNDDPEAIIHRADLAMYDAKKRGKNRICTFVREMEDHPAKILQC